MPINIQTGTTLSERKDAVDFKVQPIGTAASSRRDVSRIMCESAVGKRLAWERIRVAGAEWQSVSSGAGRFGLRSVCYGQDKSLFVAVGGSSISGVDARPFFVTSSDGVNWITGVGPSNQVRESVCYAQDKGLFVAVASMRTNQASTSTNGTTWSSHATPMGLPNAQADMVWASVCYAQDKNLFVAVGRGTGEIVPNTYPSTYRHYMAMTSSDGMNWSIVESPTSVLYSSVCYAQDKGLFVAVGNAVVTSTNGRNWTTRSAPESSWLSVCYAQDKSLFVAVRNSSTTGDSVMTSSDGTNWTARNTPENYDWRSVCYAQDRGLFVAVGRALSSLRSYVMTSPDGINWTVHNAPYGSWRSVCYAPDKGIFVTVGGESSGIAMFSPY